MRRGLSMKLYEFSATEAIKKIKDRDISIRQLIESCVRRIADVERRVHAWAFYDESIVYEQLAQIESRLEKGAPDGYFYGVPFGVKDIFNTEDMPVRMGSKVWGDFFPGNDARVVHNIRIEGGIIMGKTVTAEFAVHHPGPTLNPHNPDYFPGTSSTGSAVAVATGMVPLAIGTQTAGSIIKPASYCGVYGYKPSFGLLPRIGVLKTVDPLDHVGFFARSCDDLKLSLDALRVRGDNYPYVKKYIENKSRQDKGRTRPWRVAFVKTHVWDDAEDYTKKAIGEFIKKISKLKGIKVVEKELPEEFKRSHIIHGTIYDKALSYYFKEECAKHPDLISSVFKDMTERGKAITFDAYKRALEDQARLTLLLDDWFKDYDVLFSIATAGIAPKKEDFLKEKPDASLIWTMCRVPSVSLPVFKGPKGLPFGIQAVGRRYNDYLLLSFLKFLEKEEILKGSEIVQ
jgi:Asp-tRNA(Asn)/Glu-tRNA(Gln) amidotransferase A subunit family amidase